MNIVKRVWKAVVPEPCRKLVWVVFRRPFVLLVNSFRERSGRKKVVAWLKANGEACIANGTWEEGASRERLDDIIAYLEKKPLTFWPGSYHYKHNYKDLYKQTFYSKEHKRFYVLYKNRKIYMKKGMNKRQPRKTAYFRQKLLQQPKDLRFRREQAAVLGLESTPFAAVCGTRPALRAPLSRSQHRIPEHIVHKVRKSYAELRPYNPNASDL